MDRLTPEQRHKNMQAVKSKDSKIELLLRQELWKRGLRYRKNTKSVFGHPDIAFIGKKVAVFCDSEFWHGYVIVKEDGDVLAYHIYNRGAFETYLLNNTKLERGSTSRHGFASIYKDNGKYYINLNLQIRFT